MKNLYERLKYLVFTLFQKQNTSTNILAVEESNLRFAEKQSEFLRFLDSAHFLVLERKASPQIQLTGKIRDIKSSRRAKEKVLLEECQLAIEKIVQREQGLSKSIRKARNLVQSTIFASDLFFDKSASVIAAKKIKDKPSLEYLTRALLDNRVQEISGIHVEETQEGLLVSFVDTELYSLSKIKAFVAMEIISQRDNSSNEALFLAKQVTLWYSYLIEEQKKLAQTKRECADHQKNLEEDALDETYNIGSLKWGFQNLMRKEKNMVLELYYDAFQKLLEDYKNQKDHLGDIVVEPLIVTMDELMSRLDEDIAGYLEHYPNEGKLLPTQKENSVEQISLENNNNYSKKVLEDIDYLREKVLK